MVKIQITTYDRTNTIKPLSTIIEVETIEQYKANQKEYNKIAYKQIANKKYCTSKELFNKGYTSIKWREYSEEVLAKAKKENMIYYTLKKLQEKNKKI